MRFASSGRRSRSARSPTSTGSRRSCRGPPPSSLLAGPPNFFPGRGRQVLAPVWVGALAAARAAADDRDRLVSGTWALEGPDRVTMSELVDRLAGRRRRKRSLWPRAIAFGGGRGGVRMTPALVE